MTPNKPTIVQRLIGRLPDEIKRLLVGVVVYRLCADESAKTEQLAAFNGRVHLATNPEALVLPSLWYGAFGLFKGHGRERLMAIVNEPMHADEIASALAKEVPEWLAYAEPPRLAHDIRQFVEQTRLAA